MQKLKEKVSQCPPSVQEILDRANSLPANSSAESFFEETKVPRGEDNRRKLFGEMVALLPEEFIELESNEWLRKVLSGDTLSRQDAIKEINKQRGTGAKPAEQILDELWLEYIPDVESPGDLKWILPVSELRQAILWVYLTKKRLSVIAKMNSEGKRSLDEETQGFIFLELQNGIIRLGAMYPIDVLVNEQIDTRRIKQCNNCKCFFWAKRLNKNGETELCEKCSNLARQKRFQSNNKDELKRQRRENYYYKKGYKVDIDFCGKCIWLNAKCTCDKNEKDK